MLCVHAQRYSSYCRDQIKIKSGLNEIRKVCQRQHQQQHQQQQQQQEHQRGGRPSWPRVDNLFDIIQHAVARTFLTAIKRAFPTDPILVSVPIPFQLPIPVPGQWTHLSWSVFPGAWSNSGLLRELIRSFCIFNA